MRVRYFCGTITHMITNIFHILISQPLYNCFVFLINIFPFFDAGVIVIIFTIIVKIILLPLSIKASKAQIQMKGAEKDLNDIKEKYKDNKEEQSRKTIDYYKEKGINPFAGIFVLLIQLPIIIGLYRVFLTSGLPKINSSMLYHFVSAPAGVNMMFLNIINIASKSVVLALIAGISTYIQMDIATKSQNSLSGAQTTGGGMQQEIMKSMTTQMKYIFPVLVAYIAYSISAALALYWITNNIFSIAQEIYIKKKYHKTPPIVI